MDIFDIIKKRHSYRDSFTSYKIPQDDLLKIAAAGIQAPAARNIQTTEFLIVNDAALVKNLGDIIDKIHFRTARAVILCMVNEKRIPEDYLFVVQNYSVAVENMLLAITSLGYASVWTDSPLRNMETYNQIHQLFSLPDHIKIEVMLPIGLPAKSGKQKAKPSITEHIYFNTYK